MPQAAEIRWVIDGFTPDTIPMPRLVEYMSELMKLFGDEESLRFVRVDPNCVAVVNKVVSPGALARMERGLRNIERGQGAPAREAAYLRINEMLAEDGTRAYIKRGSAIILRFPGLVEQVDHALRIEGVANVTGYLYHLSEEANGTINLRVRQPNHPYVRCVAPLSLGGQLRELLFSSVRLTGKGQWVRSAKGVWTVSDLEVVRAVRVKEATIREVVDAVRRISGKWDRDPLGRHAKLNDEDKGG